MPPPKILIIGAGIAGPTLATFLLLANTPASQKPHITLLERSPALRPQGQNIDIRGAGVTIIRKLGLEDVIRASLTGEAGVQHVDEDNHVWAQLGASKAGGSPTSDIEILRGRLAEIMFKRSKLVSDGVEREGGVPIEYLFGDYVDEVEQDGEQVRVRFAKSGDRRAYDLVVAADGLLSKTRGLVFGAEGEEERVRRLGMYSGFFSIPVGETDSDWRRWFHKVGGRSIMLRPDGTGERTTVTVLVLSEEGGRFEEVATGGSKQVPAQKELLAESFRNAGWESDRVIKGMMEADDFYYAVVAQIKMEKFTKGRVALLGDAGYCASPFSGMGTTLALNGAYNLAGALTAHPDDHAAAFAEYEEKMRPIAARAQKLAPGMPRSLNPETWWGLLLLKMFAGFLAWSRLVSIVAMFAGPPADYVPIEEYGLKSLPEMGE